MRHLPQVQCSNRVFRSGDSAKPIVACCMGNAVDGDGGDDCDDCDDCDDDDDDDDGDDNDDDVGDADDANPPNHPRPQVHFRLCALVLAAALAWAVNLMVFASFGALWP